MKYRVQSANVLNDADKFQGILEYQLFCMEQETMLFGYNEDVDWLPGKPMYQDPRNVWRDDDCGCGCENDGDLEGYYGHHVRPMIQTMEFMEAPEDEGAVSTGLEFMRAYPHMRCEPCGVSWNVMEENNCWMCGAFLPFPRRMTKTMEFKNHFNHSLNPIGFVESFERFEEGMRVAGRMYQEVLENMMRSRASLMRGVSAQMAIYDEAFRVSEMVVYSRHDVMINPFHIEPYSYHPDPSPNPFEREEREIELVRPVAPNVTEPVRGYLQPVPAEWAAMRPTIPLPERPEPRDFSRDVDRLYWERLNPDYYRRNRS